MLLEGDAERKSEQRFAEEQPEADLLKVAHHGSATSTIPQLLAAVHPSFRVDFCGRAKYLRPSPGERFSPGWRKPTSLTYRTDLDGAVTFYLDGKTVSPVLP